MRRFFLFLFLMHGIFLYSFFPKTVYPFCYEPIDVVIPCHPKDAVSLERCIKGIRKNGVLIRRVIVVSSEPLTDQAEWFDEKNYPFTKDDLLKEIFQREKSSSRIGWVYQQLLKLYAFLVIPNISSNILILDADTVFLKPVHFLTPLGEPFFNWGKELHPPYFEFAQRLLPDFQKVFQRKSGVTHHMLFQKAVLDDLFEQIETVHHIPVWQAIARSISKEEFEGASLSEYELYFNFIFSRTDQARFRFLKWTNIHSLEGTKEYRKNGYDYVSCHIYELLL